MFVCSALGILTLLVGVGGYSAAEEALDAVPPIVTAADRQVYVVETARSSGGRLFFAPTEPGEGVWSGAALRVQGGLLSRSTTGTRRMTFAVYSAIGEALYSVDLTVDVEPGSAPFGFEWPLSAALEGDYRAQLMVLDPALGEDARAEWRVSVRDAAAVAARVEAAREAVVRIHEESTEKMPESAQEELSLALESLVPFPSAERPLIEADENAKFAMRTAAHVRAEMTFRRDGQIFLAPAQPESVADLLSTQTPLIGSVVLGAHQDAGARLKQFGFDFLPLVTSIGTTPAMSELPAIVWIEDAGGETRERTPDTLQALGRRDDIAAVSLWTAPRAPAHDAQTVVQFRNHVESVYGDRTKLNRAWKQHLFSFDEVEFWPGIENRAYLHDVQSFERQRTTQWISERLHEVEPILTPAAATITFTDGMLVPGEARLGLDAEAIAPTLPLALLRIAGPLEDARYAQRYPASNVMYALFRSFAPGMPLLALQSLDYDLNDRLRMDSAAHLRTLAVEAAIEGVSALAIEIPALADAAQGAPEAVNGFAAALRDLRGAQPAIAALRAEPAPVAMLWSDSSKGIDSGTAHLSALISAYEGCSFSGQNVGFITERQLANGQWAGVRVLVLPDVTALTAEAFAGIESLVASGAAVIRTESGPVYDEHGRALGRTLDAGVNSILVQGEGEPRGYLDAVDELMARGFLPDPPRAITASGFPIEGVKTRYTKGGAGEFLYVVNLRKEAVSCRLNRDVARATDVLTGRIVEFPRTIDPLSPMLLQLDAPPEE